jgi:hypothetical protein
MKKLLMIICVIIVLYESSLPQGNGFALQFDGIDDYVDFGNSPALNVGSAVTYEVWIKPDTSVAAWILNKWVGFQQDIQLSISGGIIGFYLYNVFGGTPLYTDSAIPLNQYTHIAATYNGTTANFYINGVLENSKSVSSFPGNSSGNLFMGFNPDRAGAEYPFKGIVDELRIWNSARTETEIQSTMYRELNGNEPGLVGYWNFNEATGSVTADHTGNGNDGMISGAIWVDSGTPLSQIIVMDDSLYVGENDTIKVDLLRNDSGDSLKILSLNLQGTLGEVTINEGDTLINYGAPSGYNGTDSFQYTVVNNTGDSAIGKVLVNILPGLSADYHTVALYKFEEEETDEVIDYSSSNNHATGIGTQSEDGVFGSSRYFNGIDDYINMDAARTALNESTEWTIEYLAKAVADSIDPPGLINHWCGNGWLLYPRRSNIAYGIKTSAHGSCQWLENSWLSVSTDRIDTLWHYYALTYRSGDSLRVYKDGIQIIAKYVSGVFRPTQNTTQTANLGHSDSGQGSFQEGFADEVRVSSVARSPEEIAHTFILLNQRLNLPTNVLPDQVSLLSKFYLSQNYPNPFNPATVISYQMPVSSNVILKVYDVLGNEVATLVDEYKPAGVYEVELDANNLSSGVYFYRIQAGSFNQVRKMILIK